MRSRVRLYLNVMLYKQFASLCKLLNLNICDVLEQYMTQFIEQHKNQTQLDCFNTKTQTHINITNITNNYNIILAKIAKLDPYALLEKLSKLDIDAIASDKIKSSTYKEMLSETIIEVSRLLEEIKLTNSGIPDEYADVLSELLAKATQTLQKLLERKKEVVCHH